MATHISKKQRNKGKHTFLTQPHLIPNLLHAHSTPTLTHYLCNRSNICQFITKQESIHIAVMYTYTPCSLMYVCPPSGIWPHRIQQPVMLPVNIRA